MKRFLVITGVVLLVLGGVVGVTAWYKLFRKVPTHFADDEEHFKYGSFGVEEPSGLPFLVWKALPTAFPEKLPGGYESFGFIYEPGHDSPIGMPVKTIGFPRIGINCALCHLGTYRTSPDGPNILARGAPASTVDVQRYIGFLMDCGSDPKFTPDHLLAAMEKNGKLGFLDRTLYRLVVIPQVKKALLAQQAGNAWIGKRPDAGPGRVDPFTAAKLNILKLPDTPADIDPTTGQPLPEGQPRPARIGNADMLSVWNWKKRDGFSLHTDGVNTSLHEIVLNSGIGNGASAKSIDLESLARIEKMLIAWDPVKYPFPIDQALAGKGRPLYQQHCASCHDFGQKITGQPMPIQEEGTDRARFDSFTADIPPGFHGLTLYSWRYEHFRKTEGYVSPALDGIWLRAPYLHNGSVPNLQALLAAPEARPKTFFRGYNLYDPVNVGFVSDSGAEQFGRPFDTSVPGNHNTGHAFGSTLAPDEKQALLEYLKTL